MTKLYLGFDGAYVLSRYPLKVFEDFGTPYLAPTRADCMDLQPSDARAVLGKLKLKKFEVVELTTGKRTKVKP